MSETPLPPQPPANSKADLLQTLLSGDNSVELLTLGMIIFSGGANFLNTQSTSGVIHADVQRAVNEVHAMFDKIDDFERRQKSIINSLKDVANSNADQLKIQRTLLENNEAFLKKNDQEMSHLASILNTLNKDRQRKNSPPDF